MPFLVLIRTGESEADVQGVLTGQEDYSLTQNGIQQIITSAQKLRQFQFDLVFLSTLNRAKQTFDTIKQQLGINEIPMTSDSALNERSFGIYSGQTKDAAAADMGQVEFQNLFATIDATPPGGESLKVVIERVSKFYQEKIQFNLKTNKNVLIIGHSDSLRALVKYLDFMDDLSFLSLSIAPAQVYSYELDTNAKVISKTIL